MRFFISFSKILPSKDGQMALCAAHSRFWKNAASQQSSALQRALTSSTSPNVAEIDMICKGLLKIVENFTRFAVMGQKSPTNTSHSTSEVTPNHIQCSELSAKLASIIAQTILSCLEHGVSMNV